jgi:hypothetical protein
MYYTYYRKIPHLIKLGSVFTFSSSRGIQMRLKKHTYVLCFEGKASIYQTGMKGRSLGQGAKHAPRHTSMQDSGTSNTWRE